MPRTLILPHLAVGRWLLAFGGSQPKAKSQKPRAKSQKLKAKSQKLKAKSQKLKAKS